MTYYDGDYEITITTSNSKGVGMNMHGYCKDLQGAAAGLEFLLGEFIPFMIGGIIAIAVLSVIF